MKKTGVALLIVGVLVALEALVRGQGTITMETTVFSLTLMNLAYLLYTKGQEKSEIENIKMNHQMELNKVSEGLRNLENAEEVREEEIVTTFEEAEERDFDFVRLIHKFSNIRIESLLENTKDTYQKRELQRVLEKRRGLI